MTRLQRQEPVSVFSTVYGQQDNLGDSVLRRGLLDAARTKSSQLHLYVGDCSRDFLSALGLHDDDELYSDRTAWRRSLLQHALKRRASYLFNAGESGATGRYVSWGTVLLLAAVRARGGQVIHSGVGLRRPAAVQGRNLRFVLRLSSFVTWRDPVSAAAALKGVVQPDWAFAIGGDGSERTAARRNVLAVSLRGDRELPNEEWYRVVRDLAASEGLGLLAVSQVRRDNERTRQLAETLECAANIWDEDDDHQTRERQMRDIYRRSRAVLSDRLHALVIGATEGAQPLGYVPTATDKIQRTLEPAGWTDVCFAPDHARPERDHKRLSEIIRRNDVLQKTAQARARLTETSALLRRLIDPNTES